MASQFDEQERARDLQAHQGMEQALARTIHNRDQTEAYYRDATGHNKKAFGELLSEQDENLSHFSRAHADFTDQLIEKGSLPEEKRIRRDRPADGPATGDLPARGPNDGPVDNRDRDAYLQAKTPRSTQGFTPGTEVPKKDEGVVGAARRGFTRGALQGLQMNMRSAGRGGTSDAQKETGQEPAPKASSQAGLGAHAGGQAKSLPSVPAPGQPGSRFNPRVADHSVPGVNAGKKSLNIARSADLIQGLPPTIANSGADGTEQGVAGAAVKGFAGGVAAGAQLNSDPALSISDTGVKPGAGSAPVRNASGQTLQDLTASTPVEDALPGTTQPFALDAIDAIQGKSPKTQGGPAKTVAMNPDHVAALEALDEQRDEGLGRGGDGYGRR